MKTKVKYFSLFIIPLSLLMLTVVFNEARGPFYFSTNSDPTYLYIVNSLNVAQLKSVKHVDNPGTTVHVIGGLTIKAIALFKGTKAIDKAVFADPEYYLEAINKVLLFLNLTGVFGVGLLAFLLTKSIGISLLLQLAPYTSWNTIKSFIKVSPEPVSLFASLLLVMVILVWLYRNRKTNYIRITLLFSLVVAFGIATKLTFVPFLVLPLILLPGIKQKLLFVIFTALLFHIFLIPALPEYGYLIQWVKDLFLHSGQYGEGPQNIVSLSAFFSHLKRIIILDHTFIAIVGFAWLSVGMVFYKKGVKAVLANRKAKALLALCISISLQLVFISKHYNPHYLISSYMLSAITVYLAYKVFTGEVSLSSLKKHTILWLKLALILMVGGMFILRHHAHRLPESGFTEWFSFLLTNYLPAYMAFSIVMSGILLIVTRKNGAFQKANLVLNIALITVLLAYQIRHIDLQGLYGRLINNKSAGMKVIGFIENNYQDAAKIAGERSSSKLFALKFGAFWNFKQPEHFKTLAAYYQDENIYFWGFGSANRFYTWEGEITLNEIMAKHQQVILQGDTNYLTPQNLELIELENDVRLKKVFDGKLEKVFLVVENEYRLRPL